MKYRITLNKNGEVHGCSTVDQSLSDGIVNEPYGTVIVKDTRDRAISASIEYINDLIESKLEDILNLNKQLKALNSL